MIVCHTLPRSPEYPCLAPILMWVGRFDRAGIRLESGIHYN